VIPVNARFAFDKDNGTFRMRVNTQVKRPDGTRYEIEIETGADLGALMTILLQLWSGSSFANTAFTAMQQPSPVVMPIAQGD